MGLPHYESVVRQPLILRKKLNSIITFKDLSEGVN